jgi:hypothetical protein
MEEEEGSPETGCEVTLATVRGRGGIRSDLRITSKGNQVAITRIRNLMLIGWRGRWGVLCCLSLRKEQTTCRAGCTSRPKFLLNIQRSLITFT